jgi:hypothetical protein
VGARPLLRPLGPPAKQSSGAPRRLEHGEGDYDVVGIDLGARYGRGEVDKAAGTFSRGALACAMIFCRAVVMT